MFDNLEYAYSSMDRASASGAENSGSNPDRRDLHFARAIVLYCLSQNIKNSLKNKLQHKSFICTIKTQFPEPAIPVQVRMDAFNILFE